jgi:UTP--glucose-1-phosphate uridylyltransferase
MTVKKKITKAIIPAAGFGTRLFPATKAIKKELFPIIDRDGKAKPLIMAIVEEAIRGGIEEVGIVVQSGDRDIFTDFFKSPPQPELWQKLSSENREYCQYLQQLGDRITILLQTEQEGYGHAVYCAKDWVNNEPFLLLLGDHIYTSDTDFSCSQQILNVYQQVQKSVVGLTLMSADIIHKAGCVTGIWQNSNSILEITQVYEKPSLEYAQKYLRTEGMKDNEFLGVFGMYALEPQIFELLELDIKNNERYKGEFQLTTCLDKLRQTKGLVGYLVQGQYFDTGMPLFYRQTMIDFFSH